MSRATSPTPEAQLNGRAPTSDPGLLVTPPHDLQAEDVLLASALQEPAVTFKRAGEVHQSDFYGTANGRTWGLLKLLFARDTPADALVLREEARRRGLLEEIGGCERIEQLVLLDVRPSVADRYGEIVRDFAKRRAVLQACHAAAERAQVSGVEALDVLRREAEEAVFVHAPHGEAGADAASLSLQSGADLLAVEENPADELWPGVVARGMFTLLAGLAKAGKSWLSFAFAQAMASGRPWMGRTHEPLSVLYVTEEGLRTLRPRIRRFGGEAVQFVTPSAFPRGWDWRRRVDAAYARARAERVGLVVWDTLLGLAQLPADAANDDGAAAQALDPVAAGATVDGFAVLGLHHARKDDGAGFRSILGGNAWRRIPDVLAELRVQGDEESHDRALSVGGRLDDGGGRFVLRHVEGSGDEVDRFDLLGSPSDARAARLRTSVLELLQGDDHWWARDAIPHGVGGRRAAVLAALDDLVKESQLIERWSGTRGAPRLYGRHGLPDTASAIHPRPKGAGE